jgi:hypothetical protein
VKEDLPVGNARRASLVSEAPAAAPSVENTLTTDAPRDPGHGTLRPGVLGGYPSLSVAGPARGKESSPPQNGWTVCTASPTAYT